MMTTTRTARGLAALSLTLLALTACSGDGTGGDDGGGRYGGGQQTEQVEEMTEGGEGTADEGMTADGMVAGAGLATAETDLGTIVVDGEGMVVYQFDSDEQGSGSSTCEGQCTQNWPAVPGDGSAEAEGLTGEVGSITGVDGQDQLTLNGWPLYYYVGDTEPGDTTGQGVGDVWWVLTPAGEPIRE